jgi:hypothetical protein
VILPFEVEIAIATLKRNKSPDSGQIVANSFIQEGEGEIHELNSTLSKEKLLDQW